MKFLFAFLLVALPSLACAESVSTCDYESAMDYARSFAEQRLAGDDGDQAFASLLSCSEALNPCEHDAVATAAGYVNDYLEQRVGGVDPQTAHQRAKELSDAFIEGCQENYKN